MVFPEFVRNSKKANQKPKADLTPFFYSFFYLKILGLGDATSELNQFWPPRGPQWDALGRSRNKYFLVEAKANILEILSSVQAKAEKSTSLIQYSIEETKKYLRCEKGKNWEHGFYQYANRISHLYFLRIICKLDAYLVFVYFCNDHTHIPTTKNEWRGAIKLQESLMSLSRHKMRKHVASIFISVEDI